MNVKKHILVTGATGFLGGNLCQILLKQGYKVTAMGRNMEKLQMLAQKGAKIIKYDLKQPLQEIDDRIDSIVHTAAKSAAFGRYQDFYLDNVVATSHIVDFAQQQKVSRLVNISSPSIYFTYKDQLNVAEDMSLPKAVNAYAKTKKMAEDIVLQAQALGVINLRPRGIYGAGDQSLLPRLQRAAQRPLPALRGERPKIDLTHVDDVCAAIIAAIEAPKACDGHSFNISSGEPVAIQYIVEKSCAYLNTQVQWRKMPFLPLLALTKMMDGFYHIFMPEKEPPITAYTLGLFAFAQSLDITKAQTMLHWQPQISFEQGLQRTFEEQI